MRRKRLLFRNNASQHRWEHFAQNCRATIMPLLEAPTNFDDESSPENSLAAELGAGNAIPVAAQLRIQSPEPRQPPGAGGRNTFGAFRLPTIRLHNPRTFAQARAQAQAAAAPAARVQRTGGIRADIFAELEAEVNEAESWLRVGLAPPPVVNLLPVTLPPQVAEPQLDELLRRVTQRTDLHNVETVRLRVISAITVSLSRLAMFLPRLHHLDLSGSVLCSLRDLGCGLIHLAHLNVSNCGLNSFDGTSGMPSLRELIADSNMIQRVGPLAQLPLLQRLSARSNRISDLSLLTFLAMCPNLSEVSLQGNPVCHLPLYRHTLQRSVRTLRLIDSMPVQEEHFGEHAGNLTTVTSAMSNSNEQSIEAERVAVLNRRNAQLRREASTTSTTSTHSSSSLSISDSPANTASDNEALSSLSSEYQDAINAPADTFTIQSTIPSATQSQSELSFLSATSAQAAATAASANTNLSESLASLTAIRCLRRPATAPIENSSHMAFDSNAMALSTRPASASAPAQLLQPVLSPGAASSSIIAGSVLDLVRRQRRRLYGHHNPRAWMSESNGSTSSGSSSTGSNRSLTTAVNF